MSKLEDQRVLVRENIGAALAVLRRLDHYHLDEDVHQALTLARQQLSVMHSRLYERTQAKEQP